MALSVLALLRSYLLLLLLSLSTCSHGFQQVGLGATLGSSAGSSQGRALGRLSLRKVSADTVPALEPPEEYDHDFTADTPSKSTTAAPTAAVSSAEQPGAAAAGKAAPVPAAAVQPPEVYEKDYPSDSHSGASSSKASDAAASREDTDAPEEDTDTVPAVQPPEVYDRDFPSDGHHPPAGTAVVTTHAPSSTPAPPPAPTVAPVTIQDLLPEDIFSRDYVSDDPAIPPGQTLFSYSLGVINNASLLLREATDILHRKERAAHEQVWQREAIWSQLQAAHEDTEAARAAYTAGREALVAANATRDLLNSSRLSAAATAAKVEEAYRRGVKATGNASAHLIDAMDEPRSVERQAMQGMQSSRSLAMSLADLERSLADVRLSLSNAQSRVEGVLQTTPTCYNGWEQPPGCVTTFEYGGRRYTGCTNVDAISYWCSFDVEYQGNYTSCTACREDEQIVLQREHEDLNKTYQELQGAASMSQELLAQAQALESIFTSLINNLSDAVPPEAQEEREVWLTAQAREEALRKVLALTRDLADEAAKAYLCAATKSTELQLRLHGLYGELALAAAREASLQASFRNASSKSDTEWLEVESVADHLSNLSYDALLDLRSAYYEVNPPRSSARPRTCGAGAAGLIVATLALALSQLAGVRC